MQKKLHLISYPQFFEQEAEVISSILAETDLVFHLRKPEADEKAYEAFLKCIPERFYAHIILHSAYHLAKEYRFAGLHFSTLKRKRVNGCLCDLAKSTSCHSLHELKSLSSVFCSCFLSPVFSSISKVGYVGDFDLKKLEHYLKSERKVEIIALGGVNEHCASAAMKMGFDAVAVLGAVWGKNPQEGDDFVGKIRAISERL